MSDCKHNIMLKNKPPPFTTPFQERNFIYINIYNLKLKNLMLGKNKNNSSDIEKSVESFFFFCLFVEISESSFQLRLLIRSSNKKIKKPTNTREYRLS